MMVAGVSGSNSEDAGSFHRKGKERFIGETEVTMVDKGSQRLYKSKKDLILQKLAGN